MVKIRLVRGGTKNASFYRIVAIDQKRSQGGRALEVIGYWYPSKKLLKFSSEKLKKWVSSGAHVTKAVDRLISQ